MRLNANRTPCTPTGACQEPKGGLVPRDIIVVGASAGGADAITRLLTPLPADLRAAVFVVLHVAPAHKSVLPRILARRAALAVSHAVDGEAIERGHVYIAPPDLHMLLSREGTISLTRGPRENRSRPALDPLFRSAALAYGPRAVGVVLSGTMGDGTAGLQMIKRMGGLAIVQEPGEAEYDGMPRSAIRNVEVDHILPVDAIAGLLVDLAREAVPENPGTAHSPERELTGADPMDDSLVNIVRKRSLERADLQDADLTDDTGAAEFAAPVPLACPECGGTLWEVQHGGLRHYAPSGAGRCGAQRRRGDLHSGACGRREPPTRRVTQRDGIPFRHGHVHDLGRANRGPRRAAE
jgi:two-component system chemotaxis response regulator CheB